MNATPPITYKFTTFAEYNGSEDVFCHGIFKDSDNGNTLPWQFINSVAPNPTTWSAAVASTTSPIATTTITVTPSSSQTSLPNTLTPGQSAGIGIGAGVAVCLAALLAVYLIRCLRPARSTNREIEAMQDMRQELPGISHQTKVVELESKQRNLV
jgi:hypothetical protein